MYDVVIDFALSMPDNPSLVAIQARVFMSPQHAKALFKALGENLKKYEEKFGLIPLPADVVIDKYIKEFFEEHIRIKRRNPKMKARTRNEPGKTIPYITKTENKLTGVAHITVPETKMILIKEYAERFIFSFKKFPLYPEKKIDN